MKDNKNKLNELNELFKSVRENKTYKLELFDTYRVLKLNEKSLKALNDYGLTELKTTYISSKKYSDGIIDTLISILRELDFKLAE
ncbi:MAG: hypothetical protein J6S67_07050 [Methanobrevibacter sp.]|nr:hypothetical protein [Methanobrevibacter sp.]